MHIRVEHGDVVAVPHDKHQMNAELLHGHTVSDLGEWYGRGHPIAEASTRRAVITRDDERDHRHDDEHEDSSED
jgi:hypothetical protein